MPSIFLTEPGAVLSTSEGRLVVSRNGVRQATMPVSNCDSVTLFGGVEITRGALDVLFRRGVAVHWVTSGGKPVGNAMPYRAHAAILRLGQAKLHASHELQLRLASELVREKIRHQRAHLADRDRTHTSPRLARAILALDGYSCLASEAASLSTLRLIEARSSRANFRAIAALLPQGWEFAARLKRPPPDPFNALLSFGYTLLLNETLSLIVSRGLDPMLGFMHGTIRNHPSLALDLMEPYRASVVERLALTLVHQRSVCPGEFVQGAEGCYLAEASARRKVVGRFREAMGLSLPRYSDEGSARHSLARSVDAHVHLVRPLGRLGGGEC